MTKKKQVRSKGNLEVQVQELRDIFAGEEALGHAQAPMAGLPPLAAPNLVGLHSSHPVHPAVACLHSCKLLRLSWQDGRCIHAQQAEISSIMRLPTGPCCFPSAPPQQQLAP